jgi:hypothetical protein
LAIPTVAQHHDHEQRRGQVEGPDQHGQVRHRTDAVLADREGEGPEGADRGGLHDDVHQLEEGLGHHLQEVDHRTGRLADQGQRQAEQDRDQQHLQDLALGEGADHGGRDDVHQEADDRLVVGLGGVFGDLVGLQGGGSIFMPAPGWTTLATIRPTIRARVEKTRK